jgi:hypothetical protein
MLKISSLTTAFPQINAQRYPVWASLARDYLSVMSASVSSERAFSQGGITISKRRNRLKGDIVEALQCVKCLLRRDLLFREPGPSSLVEEPDDSDTEAEARTDRNSDDYTDNEGWDILISDDSDGDDEASEIEMEDTDFY